MASVNPTMMVRKRNGTIVDFDLGKIANGIKRSAADVGVDINGRFNSLMDSIHAEVLAKSAQNEDCLVGAQEIQGIVKRNLMDSQMHEIAEAYILFSDRQNKMRLEPDANLISDYITLSRYARFNDMIGRREIYPEICDRVEAMHLRRYPAMADTIKWAMGKVRTKECLPSMRSMQFGGAAMEANHSKGYNCSFSVCNRPKFFSEAFWLLLSGTGVGFSVQFHHVDQLPEVRFIDRSRVKHFVIPDTIEGWSDAAHELIKSYLITGTYFEPAYHEIRQQNTPLKTSGGRAPGHLPLRDAIEAVRVVLDKAQGRQLKPIECFDIMCLFANAVYSGGIREAAMITLFSLDDGEMMNSKTGNWYDTHPWRARSNNSVVLSRKDAQRRQFDRVFRATKQWGEPGFFFTDDEDIGANPCVEIGLNPKLEITPELKIQIEHWAQRTNRKIQRIKVGQVFWGWQMCNLTEVNAATATSAEDLYERVRAAATIATLQAGYTDFPYLGWVSEAICNREALLGVSMTGVMDNPKIALDPEVQRNAAQIAVETNIDVAAKIGINSAARVTCGKPSGTASLVLGCIGSGFMPHHATRYFRRIRVSKDCPVYQFFKKHNPHMCTSLDDRKDIITFPVKAPDDALTRRDVGAVQFLDKILSSMKNWVLPGTAKPHSSPCSHNISNTINIKDDEWDDVREFIWKNRKYLNGIAMLSDRGDKTYANAPREEVTTAADEAKWQDLINNYKPIDWTTFSEAEDNTALSAEKACAGGACQI